VKVTANEPALPETHVRDHLANERTYLAYMRTAIALVSFGITINRFSLFLLEKDVLLLKQQPTLLVSAENAGIIMIFLGMACMLWGAVHYTDVSDRIERGTYHPQKRAIWILTLIVLVFGSLTLYWLFQR
jgi:putative membrane protein